MLEVFFGFTASHLKLSGEGLRVYVDS
jgi:hypothetical protein